MRKYFFLGPSGVFLLIASLVFIAPAFAGSALADSGAPAPAVVTVGGEVALSLQLDEKALAAMPHHDANVSVHGQAGTWSGVELADILRAAGVPLGEALRGRNLLLQYASVQPMVIT